MNTGECCYLVTWVVKVCFNQRHNQSFHDADNRTTQSFRFEDVSVDMGVKQM